MNDIEIKFCNRALVFVPSREQFIDIITSHIQGLLILVMRYPQF